MFLFNRIIKKKTIQHLKFHQLHPHNLSTNLIFSKILKKYHNNNNLNIISYSQWINIISSHQLRLLNLLQLPFISTNFNPHRLIFFQFLTHQCILLLKSLKFHNKLLLCNISKDKLKRKNY